MSYPAYLVVLATGNLAAANFTHHPAGIAIFIASVLVLAFGRN